MPLFACKGYPAVEAVNAHEAARFFAKQAARLEYGASSHCSMLRLISASAGLSTFRVFIGAYRAGVTHGQDIVLTVEEALPPGVR
jgi:hypothetical protein